MPRHIATVILAGLALAPAAASAQSPPPPRVEFGVQASTQTGERRSLSWSPRFTLTLTPASALEFTADIRPPRSDSFSTRTSGQWYAIHLRQLLYQRGRWQLSGVVGAGGGQTTQAFAGRTIEGRDGPVTYPPSRYREWGLAGHVGASAQYEISGRLAVRADVRATASENGGLRAMVGGVVPIGRRFRADSTRENLMDEHDSLTNGLVIGAASGAATTAALAGVYSLLLCEQDDCDGFFVGSVLVGAAIGTAIGAVLGGVIDSLIPGRRARDAARPIRNEATAPDPAGQREPPGTARR